MKHYLWLIPAILFLFGCEDAPVVPPPAPAAAATAAEKSAAPQERTRIDKVGSVAFGKSAFRYFRERRILRERFVTADDLLELYCTPLSNQIWRIDLVVPVMPGSEASDPLDEMKKFIGKKFDLDFSFASAFDLPDTRVEVSRAFDRGHRGVRCSFIDRELEKLWRKESSSPEAVSQRLNLRAHDDILRMEAAIRRFYQDTGNFPARLTDLLQAGNISRWQGPYLDSIPLDPWDKKYVYRRTDSGFELYSTGAGGSSRIR